MSNILNTLSNGDSAYARTCTPVVGGTRLLRDVWTVADAERVREYLDTLGALELMDALEDEGATDTFECVCGNHAWPLYDDTSESWTWCECGESVDAQRATTLRVLDQVSAVL